MEKYKARVIAFYLPQYHPIPENDKWWGKGFTEWTNVAKAKPLFKGHYQPRIPADLGFYDLRVPEVREAQAEMARDAGIEGFCYWHYWFGNGRQLLQRPFNEVLSSGKPDYPFCLGWANHSWTNRTWNSISGKMSESMIAEQLYPGIADYKAHFEYAFQAFKDKRYICVDGKPLFLVYDPYSLPTDFIETWRDLAHKKGLKGIHFVGHTLNARGKEIRDKDGKIISKGMLSLNDAGNIYRHVMDGLGFDAVASIGFYRAEACVKNHLWVLLHRQLALRFNLPIVNKYDYRDIVKNYYVEEDSWENVYPSLMPQWDRSPRTREAGIYVNSTPENFRPMVDHAVEKVKNKTPEHRIIFLKSWNEWAEGNYVEPDLKYGHGFLDVLRDGILY